MFNTSVQPPFLVQRWYLYQTKNRPSLAQSTPGLPVRPRGGRSCLGAALTLGMEGSEPASAGSFRIGAATFGRETVLPARRQCGIARRLSGIAHRCLPPSQPSLGRKKAYTVC